MIPRQIRTWLAIAMFLETNIVLGLLAFIPSLAEVKLFELIAQAIVMQGFLGLVLAFYFAANEAASDPKDQE